MSISYEGIGHLSVTFPNHNATEHQVCTVGNDGKVCACTEGGNFIGEVESVNATYAGVQVGGFVKLKYTGAAPAVGFTKLSANGTGGIKADAEGQGYWVVSVDTVNAMAIVKL